LQQLRHSLVAFFRLEIASSVILLGSAVLALLLANTDWGIGRYFPAVWEQHLRIGPLDESYLHWINDGLMAIFFFVVGLELKRELLEGHLSSIRQAALPVAGAIGGMVAPALLFASLNWHTATAAGWSIPMATDIAFALAVLQLLGNRIPPGLRVFLLALATVDDFGAILIIAIFYTTQLHWLYLGAGLLVWAVQLGLNRLGVRAVSAYLLLGVLLWYCALESGVHATLAGVLTAIAIPAKSSPAQPAPAAKLAHVLQPVVSFGIVPLFAFANTSLVLDLAVFSELRSSLSLGILTGLVIGKPLGVCLFCWVATLTGWATLPAGVTWRALMGAGMLAGIGFTIALFMTLLSLGEHSAAASVAKLAILLASLLSGLLGYVVLRAKLLPAA
jgi:NhaA family Na+:H+ antiporter